MILFVCSKYSDKEKLGIKITSLILSQYQYNSICKINLEYIYFKLHVLYRKPSLQNNSNVKFKKKC